MNAVAKIEIRCRLPPRVEMIFTDCHSSVIKLNHHSLSCEFLNILGFPKKSCIKGGQLNEYRTEYKF
jgi:hypothetical protein